MRNKESPLQYEYDAIHMWFKTTTELYDDLEWDGRVLEVVLNDETIETYTRTDLFEIGVFDDLAERVGSITDHYRDLVDIGVFNTRY